MEKTLNNENQAPGATPPDASHKPESANSGPAQPAQMDEAIGLIAGGIAHDFNNLLTAIRGYTWLAQRDIARLLVEHSEAAPVASALRAHNAGIAVATDSASRLARQLLALSRARTRQQAGPVDLNAVITDIKELIASFLRNDIRLDLDLAPSPVSAHIGRGQIEQVILNLVINARDAMPSGGVLAISTAPVTLPSGGHAQIKVRDTGSGIPPEIQKKVFEPFFSTKEKKQGTGLGLATCASIVGNARGRIRFETTPGRGTTFIIELPDFPAQPGTPLPGETPAAPAAGTAPASSAAPAAPATPATPATPADVTLDASSEPETANPGDTAPPMGVETVLLVEDDPAILEVTTAILESLGYTVHSFSSARELLARGARDAELLITDLNMPGMGGRELAGQLRATQPGLRALYISGFVSEDVRQSGAHFLEKPFTRDQLAQKVRQALDEKRAG